MDIYKTDPLKKKANEVKTYTVPFPIVEIQDHISISSNIPSETSKDDIINQAFKFHSQGNISEAIKYYKYFIDNGFKDPRVFTNYGVILQNIGKLKEAELSHRKAIELKPDSAIAHSNLGNTLKDLGQLKEAEMSQRKAIEIKPNIAEVHLNLGSILINMGRQKEAEISFRKSIELRPDYADAYSNLGNILRDLGQLDEAEKSTRKALDLKPDFAEGLFNLSLIELLRGDYQSGLDNYEFRYKKKNPPSLYAIPKINKLRNNDFLIEEKILIVSEQGLGDTIQYMRYIPYLRNKGFDISFCPQIKLHSLIKASGIDQNPLTPDQANKVSEGKWVPLLSLPKYLKINPKNPIIADPYIHSTKELIKKWKNILSKEKRPIIGINWQGNPEMEKAHQGRSIPLERFSSLLEQNEITMLSLQKGFGSEQLENCSFKNEFVGCQAEIDSTWDFLENAAIIENCDLIITNDTSIAHLAGGMGKKVWLLLRDIPFWTWGLEGESTFWYPSMRLFRQKERHNWNEVMNRVSKAIKIEIGRNELKK